MKIISALIAAALLLITLGCTAPADTPDDSKASDDQGQTSEAQAPADEDAVSTMDFESGEIPQEDEIVPVDEELADDVSDEGTEEGDGATD